jgi:Arc/MetJ-type ribon-helix-helix transcriptional regulator
MVAIKGKPKTDYTNVGIPKDMAEEIQRIILSDKRLGFASMQEFVKEAVRRSIVHYGGVAHDPEYH